MSLAPLPVIVPLLVAAVLLALSPWLPRRLLDIVAIATSSAVFGVCCWLVDASISSPIVYWFGGWHPMNHYAIGISFVIDPLNAGLATLVSLLVLAAFIFSWHYFESVKALYHAVMLVFLGAMCGLCLTGDLFNLFVWFELMTAAAVTLSGYKAEETGPLQGALNFAIANTVGAFLSLSGVAMLYAQTGALNMAQVARSLIDHPLPPSFLAIVFIFVAAGFLVKAAAFPFHFWLDDAHAVAPTPVCILFSGVMVELGLYAVARLWWTIFAVPMAGLAPAVRSLFLTLGILTAVVGAVACFGQRHLKRLLAFSTISHMGLMFIGFAMLDARALAGSTMYVVGHAMVKSSLFICAGILLHHFASVDEFELKGRGRRLRWTGLLLLVGALGLAGLPPFADFFGEAQIDFGAAQVGIHGLSAIFVFCGMLTAGAVLRVFGRIFLGWGQRREATARDAPHITMEHETDQPYRKTPLIMWMPAAALLLIGIVVATPTAFRAGVERHAARMLDLHGYVRRTLDGVPLPAPAAATMPWPVESLWRPFITLVGASLLALAALFPRSLPFASAGPAVRSAMRPFRAIHSGRIGDYIAWFMFGIAAYAAMLLLRLIAR